MPGPGREQRGGEGGRVLDRLMVRVCSWMGLDFCRFITHSVAMDEVHHREAGLLPPSADIILLCAR